MALNEVAARIEVTFFREWSSGRTQRCCCAYRPELCESRSNTTRLPGRRCVSVHYASPGINAGGWKRRVASTEPREQLAMVKGRCARSLAFVSQTPSLRLISTCTASTAAHGPLTLNYGHGRKSFSTTMAKRRRHLEKPVNKYQSREARALKL